MPAIFTFLLWEYGLRKKLRAEKMSLYTRYFTCVFFTIVALFFFFTNHSYAKLGNNINENLRQFGKEIITKAYTKEDKNFSGKKAYLLPYFGWQIEAIFKDGRSFSEAARPRGNKVKKQLITEKEANVIADVLFPKKERGPYRKQVKNANFISHFFESGVVSYEMKLDERRKNHVGVIGVRTVLYSNGDTFKNIMINAYH